MHQTPPKTAPKMPKRAAQIPRLCRIRGVVRHLRLMLVRVEMQLQVQKLTPMLTLPIQNPWLSVFPNPPRSDVIQYDAGVPKEIAAHAKGQGAHPSELVTHLGSFTPAVFSFHLEAVTAEKERITRVVAIHARRKKPQTSTLPSKRTQTIYDTYEVASLSQVVSHGQRQLRYSLVRNLSSMALRTRHFRRHSLCLSCAQMQATLGRIRRDTVHLCTQQARALTAEEAR